MMTFLPNKDFYLSAFYLDNKRLGNQRNETWILYKSITENKGWYNHPAAKMWKGFEIALLNYGLAICTEWRSRGFKDTVMEKFCNEIHLLNPKELFIKHPNWIGLELFHASHRSNLLRKNYSWYSQFNWKESDNLPYYWPIR